MTSWEYTTVVMEHPKLRPSLNELGFEGWELVTVLANPPSYYVWVFKRPVEHYNVAEVLEAESVELLEVNPTRKTVVVENDTDETKYVDPADYLDAPPWVVEPVAEPPIRPVGALMVFACAKCNASGPVEYRQKGPHTGKYCSNCKTWLGWCKKK